MYKINASATIRVPVVGSVAGEDGKPVKFTFGLQCKRLQQPEIDELMKDPNAPVKGFLHQVVNGWHDVVGADDQPIEFSEANFAALLDQPGMSMLCFNAFMSDIGAKPKN